MKTVSKVLFLITCMGIISGCVKDEMIKDQSDLMLKKTSKAMVQPCTSANVLEKAETDWENISEALQNAGPGEVVQLCEGTYYLHKSIVCWDFDGTLRGSGMEKTIIRTAPGMLFDVDGCPPVNWSFEDNMGSFFISFPHNYFEGERTVTVADLSIIIDEPTNRETNQTQGRNSVHGIMVYNIDLDNDRDNPVNLNVVYKNLSLLGEYGDEYNYYNYSLFSGVSGYGYSNGVFEAKNVIVENANGCIKPHAFFGPDAQVIIKNCRFDHCVFGVYAFFDHSWTVLNNSIRNSVKGIVLIKKGPYGEPWDGPEGISYIKDNWIQFEGTDAMGIGIQYASNVEVKNNILVGSSGKYGGIVSLRANNWIIKYNDLCGVSTKPVYLLYSTDFEIRNNYNQDVTAVGCSNIITGDGLECED